MTLIKLHQQVPLHSRVSLQSYNSGSMPQVPQQQMQGAGSPLPQQRPYQGHPGQNPAPMPQQNMQPTLHQAGPPSELTSSTSEESSDSDSGSSDDNEKDDDEGENNVEVTDGDREEGGEGEDDEEDGESDPVTAASHPGWPQQAQPPVMPPQAPRAASLASSLSGASKSTTRKTQPVGQTFPKAPSSVNSTLSGATGSTKHTADRSVRQEKASSTASSTVATTLSGAISKPPRANQEKLPSRASSTVPTTLSGATSKPSQASHHAKERQRQYMPTIGERQVLAEDGRSMPQQEHLLNRAPTKPASLTSTRHSGTRHSSREHSSVPGGATTHSNHDVHQPQYTPSLRTMSSSNNKGSKTSRRTSQRLRNQPQTREAPPLPYPQEANRGEANAYYDPDQTFSSRYSAPSTTPSLRPNDHISYQNYPDPSNPPIPSSSLPPPPPRPPLGNPNLPSSPHPTSSHPDNPPKPTTPDPFAHSIPPGWRATLKGFARLYLHQHLHHNNPSRSTVASTTSAAAAMRAEKYELFLRGERFFRHPVIRVCGNFRRRHYAVIAERVEEVRRAVVEGSDEDDGGARRGPRGADRRRRRRERSLGKDDGGKGGGSGQLPRRRRRRREEGGFRHTGGEDCRCKVEKRECSRADHPGYPHIRPKHHRRRR